MTGSQPVPLYRKKIKGTELPEFLRHIREGGVRAEELLFLCIGTDRSTGDALGPLVGTMLEEAGYPEVIGTLAYPFDASNMRERLLTMPGGRRVIAIDACLGQSSSLGWYQVSNRPLEPGKSVGKQLPQVGDYSIAAIVNVDAGQKYAILQSTSLYRVMTMAREIVEAILGAFPIEAPAGLERNRDRGEEAQ
ncbi:spore protease YyaC [Paenibacillus filicis]|uniref:Spore protease YyaC n=1 Tax=Paenibacillus gyeongsangnamensis TaxID=3388067 RepID=A0ABT4QF99_9BACL|nr:spore protease YyaC [Paenibacillus filicis]MCZ8515537.1 spore protease YyaC [Paenibacillus filicis]